MMRIIIPSRGRAGKIKTLAQFPEHIWKQTCLVVPRNQLSEYREHYPGTSVIGMTYEHIGEKREKIMRMFGDEKLVMVDDDLSFRRRGRPHDDVFVKATQPDVAEMFRKIEKLLDRYPLVGIVDSFMAHWLSKMPMENRRVNQLLAYNMALVKGSRPKFRLKTHEELDVQLQLITRGYTTTCITEFTKNAGKANAPGGCSAWRTAKVEMEQMRKMVELWPDYVSIVSNKNNMCGRSVKIRFKKAAGQ